MWDSRGVQPCTGGVEVMAGEALDKAGMGPGVLSAQTGREEANRRRPGALTAGRGSLMVLPHTGQ